MKTKAKTVLAAAVLLAAGILQFGWAADGGDLALRNVYSDHMLFQRDQPVVFAGTAEVGERVEVRMNGACAVTEADTGGIWHVELAPMKAGGPYEAEIRGAKRTLRLRDVLVGELWLASGQSNMAMPVTGGRWFSLTNGNEVAAAADDPLIRFAGVSRGGDSDRAHTDVSGKLGWSRGDDTNAVKRCSATAWFFARELRRRLGVPVGVVVSAWSGSCIEPWIAEDAMKRHGLARLLRQLDEARHPPAWCAEEKSFRAHRIEELAAWVKDVENTPGSHSKEAKAEWMRPDLNEDQWTVGTSSVERPAIVWMRWHVDLPAGAEGVVFEADTASDTDEAWFDGRPIGRTDASTNFYWNLKRSYPVGTVAAGRHVLAVRVNNHSGDGGVIAPRLVWADGKIDLAKLAPRVRTEAAPNEATGPRPCCPWEGATPGLKPRNSAFLPGGMYNAMIAPLDVFRFRGTIWYHGCSNADAYLGYHACQKALVDGFRRTFGRDDMAFVCVQLAGFVRHSPTKPLDAAELSSLQPSESGFVMIRDEQARIRELPGCDCATAFDIGDPSDIHPKNKRDVGRRLAGLAATLCYGGTEKARGPEVVRAERKGSAVEVTFDEPVVLRPGAAAERTFALDDETGRRHWASARQVAPDRIRVESAAAKDPTRVDYGRAPYIAEAAVFNKDGYPALPFSIDCVTRVLMIGNSFSISCLKHLPQVAGDCGVRLDLASLYIGGCPLSRHWANALSNEVDGAYKPYQFDRNVMGLRTRSRMNVLEALRMEKWDVVTVQQASHESWKIESYHPYGEKLVAKIREIAPQAKIYVQETWSYIPWDKRYKEWGIDQDEMYAKLHAAYADFAAQLGLTVIPFGTKVQEWRRRLPVKYTENSLGGDVVGGIGWQPEHWFRRNAAGEWVCRCDPCHLGERGEYFQALVWAKSLLGVSVRDCGYKPAFVSESDAKLMREIAEEN